LVTDFRRELAKIVIPPPSFCELAFHNGYEDCNADSHVNTADDPSTCDKNLVNFGPVTRVLQAYLCRAGYMLGFATHS